MAVHSLDEVRSDGWLERLVGAEPSLADLARVLGLPSLALTMMSGIRVHTLILDPTSLDKSFLEFSVGDEESQEAPTRMNVAEFRARIAQAVFAHPEPWPPNPVRDKQPTVDALQAFVGVRHVLLSPLFGYRLIEVETSADPDEHSITFEVHGGPTQRYSLENFRHQLETAVFEDVERGRRGGGFSLDLELMRSAMAAHRRGDHQAVVQMLEEFLVPLAALGRSGQARTMTPDVRGTVSESLVSLARSQDALGNQEGRLDTLRTAAQWSEEGSPAAAVYLELGRAMMQDNRAGEAIGFLRRALMLGSDEVDAYTLLADALLERGRKLAAWSALRIGERKGHAAVVTRMVELEHTLGESLAALRTQGRV